MAALDTEDCAKSIRQRNYKAITYWALALFISAALTLYMPGLI
jgi:hypothetical protein